jgi:ornithine cyclodeaminase/alanine dehydrogenase
VAPYFVSAEAIEAVFEWGEAVRAIQVAYSQRLDDRALPPRTVAQAPDAWLRTLPAIPPGARYFGAKLMGVATSTSNAGVEYVIVLFDRETSRIAAFLDAELITAYRTASTSAAALDRLAPDGPVRLGVLGSGVEATMHTRAFAAVRRLEAVAVFSPTPGRREAFAVKMTEQLGTPCVAVSTPEEAVRDATVVLAAARPYGEVPILFGDWVADSATVVSIGSTVPAQREIDVSVVARCDPIVCDSVREVLEESGDLIAAKRADVPFRDKAFGLDALMRGELDSRLADGATAMFKSVGGGLQDVVVGQLVFERALAAGLATELPVSFSHKRPNQAPSDAPR